jgi:hypothetical protein
MKNPRIFNLRWLPFGAAGMCLGPRTVLLLKGNPRRALTMAHEFVHAEQFRHLGRLRFWAWYLFDANGRTVLEAEAFARGSMTHAGQAAYYAALIRERYHPRWWFGRTPWPMDSLTGYISALYETRIGNGGA